jgi:hypothetical protein
MELRSKSRTGKKKRGKQSSRVREYWRDAGLGCMEVGAKNKNIEGKKKRR